jgi:hypothetical protein
MLMAYTGRRELIAAFGMSLMTKNKKGTEPNKHFRCSTAHNREFQYQMRSCTFKEMLSLSKGCIYGAF